MSTRKEPLARFGGGVKRSMRKVRASELEHLLTVVFVGLAADAADVFRREKVWPDRRLESGKFRSLRPVPAS
jgi:hypothetical protein